MHVDEVRVSATGRRPESSTEAVIIDRIARTAYAQPRLFGFRSREDVGEVFARYLPRIRGVIRRYRDTGSSFEAYVASTLRYLALTVRKEQARDHDRETVYLEEQARGVDCRRGIDGRHAYGSRRTVVLAPVDPRRLRVPMDPAVFRRRVLFLCAKCAVRLNDQRVETIARACDIDPGVAMAVVRAARAMARLDRERFGSRRRGRDAAWLRMGVNERRLQRETDPDRVRALRDRIERDRALHRRAIDIMTRTRTTVSNLDVARIMGVPKSTVDSGVNRLLKLLEE